MQDLKSIMDKIPRQYRVTDYDEKTFFQMRCDSYNKTKGDLVGYDCPICLNKGWIMEVVEREGRNGKTEYGDAMVKCKCSAIRDSIRRLKRSGLEKVINEYTFDSFETNEDWKVNIKKKALNFIHQSTTTWFFIGGQVGCGKSHICTAIASHFLREKKMAVRYMVWVDEVKRMKSVINDEYMYDSIIEPLKKVEVLYIDDFFKPVSNGSLPTDADVRIAYELLNYRYNNPDLITIISSERYLAEIMDIDEATGSRIYERSKGYRLNIKRDASRNHRIDGEGFI